MKKREHVAMTNCYFCNEPYQILLATRYHHTSSGMEPTKDLANFNGKIVDMNPCNKCRDFMKLGVILITIDDAKSDPNWNKPDGEKNWMPNPYRTGGWFVVKDEAVIRIIQPKEMADWAIKHRWMFIEHSAAESMGLK